MSAEMGVRPIDDNLWNVVDTTVRRLPSANDREKAAAEMERVGSENQASSRAERETAEDASRALETIKNKVITYSDDSRPAHTGGDEESSVDVKG